LNLGQYRIAIGERVGSSFTNTALNRDINFALQEIAGEAEWPWLNGTTTVTTVANQQGYALPTDAIKVLAVVDSGDTPVDPISIDDLESALWNDSITQTFGEGKFYAVDGTSIYLVPTPTKAGEVYTVRYQKTETVLAADGDAPLLPTRHDQMVVDLACYTALNRSDQTFDMRRADRFFANYQRLLKRARQMSMNKRGGPTTPRIRPGAPW